MKLAYVDSCVWITRFQGIPAYRQIVHERLNELLSAGWKFCYSGAVYLEVMIKPYRDEQREVIALYEELFREIELLPVYNNLFWDAHKLAFQNNLAAYDAVHLAYSLHRDCDLFVTTDSDFTHINQLKIFHIDLSAVSKLGTKSVERE